MLKTLNLEASFENNLNRLLALAGSGCGHLGCGHLAVAVSGGSDSVALVLLAKKWAAKNNIPLTALTVDHRLRPESAEEAKKLGEWMQTANISHEILSADREDAPQTGLPNYARNVRYELLLEWCKKHHALLLTGHQQDDVAETLMQRLARGSGVDGLAAIPAFIKRDGVIILRPMLEMSRASLREYLASQNQPWIDDPTNESDRYSRNRIRKALSAALPSDVCEVQLTKRLSDTASQMAKAKEALEWALARALADCTTHHAQGYFLIDVAGFAALPEELQFRLLKHVLCCMHPDKQAAAMPRFDELKRVHEALTLQEKCYHPLHCSLVIKEVDSPSIIICREPGRVAQPLPLDAAPFIWDGRFCVKMLQQKTDEERYYIGALGKAGIGFLKLRQKQDNTLKLSKISPAAIMETLPAIWQKNDAGVESLLSVPHINYGNDKLVLLELT